MRLYGLKRWEAGFIYEEYNATRQGRKKKRKDKKLLHRYARRTGKGKYRET